MKMDDKLKKLIAVGASVGANCHPCLEHHVGKALEAGIDRDELMMAVEIAKAVRTGAAASMDKLALHLVRERLPGTSAAGTCGCC
jgi:AhpD family alkylhydroperoxidase